MEQTGAPRPQQVLIADRHRSVAQSLAGVVARLGDAEVVGMVHTPDALLDAALSTLPDIAIIDLDTTGDPALIAALHALLPTTRIVAMVEKDAHAAHELVGALASGAVAAIYSEASLEDLERALSTSSSEAPIVAAEAAGLLLDSYMEALTEKRLRDLATIQALAAAVEARDSGTGRHQQRVTALAGACLQRIDSEAARNAEVTYGFMLHDVGKIGIADAILNKPGPLADEEWAIMRRHPELGVRIVEPIGFSQATTDVILHHHERWDGNGYPSRLRGDEIPVTARVFAVADAFDAMISDRPYRPAMQRPAALLKIEGHAGRAFDPDIVDVFLTSIA